MCFCTFVVLRAAGLITRWVAVARVPPQLYPTPDGKEFVAFGRVFSGTVRAGDSVRVLGEHYTTADEEDLAVRNIASLSISQVRTCGRV